MKSYLCVLCEVMEHKEEGNESCFDLALKWKVSGLNSEIRRIGILGF